MDGFFNKRYTVLGMMSGTSLDGVDLSAAIYFKINQKWSYQLLACKTYSYSNQQVQLLKSLSSQNFSFLEFRKKQLIYSQILVNFIQDFLLSNSQTFQKHPIELIGLHGHTIFHNPLQGITVQIGNLHYIAAKLKINVVGNFRELDVHRGGQGAPLVPFGQQIFGDSVYLNLGGIANVGWKGKGQDLVYFNIVMNQYSYRIEQLAYDKDGQIGRKGSINQSHLAFLRQTIKNTKQKSLSKQEISPFLNSIENSTLSKDALIDNLRTFYQFAREQIVQGIVRFNGGKTQEIQVFCTGGGAYNKFMLEILNNNEKKIKFLLPSSTVIDFKQSLIFGLLAVKYMEGEKNCQNGIGGCLIKGI